MILKQLGCKSASLTCPTRFCYVHQFRSATAKIARLIMAIKFRGVDFLSFDSLLNEDELLVRNTARQFVEDNVIPIIEQCNREGRFPRELVKPMAEMGFFGASLKGYGCAEMSNVEYGLVMQELERGDSGLRSFVSVQSALVMYPIYAFGSDEQKQRWLPALQRAKALGCFGLTEPDSARIRAACDTRAKKVGRRVRAEWREDVDHLRLHRRRRRGVGEERRRGRQGSRLPGRNRPPRLPRRGHSRQVVAARVGHVLSLSLQDVRVPACNLLPKTDGIKSPLMCLNQARYGIAWGAVGAAMACYDCALQYAQFRKQFRDQPIASHQLVQEKLVWMISEITKAQLLVAASRPAQGLRQGRVPAHLDGQAEQRLDGAGVRAHGARHSGRERHRRRVPDLPPHGEPGVGEDLRGNARHSHADHRASASRGSTRSEALAD